MLTKKNGAYLKHHTAYVVDALSDGVTSARYGHSPFCRVGQHLAGHLDAGAGHLADFLDFRAALADERAALRGRHDEPQRDWWPGNSSSGRPVLECCRRLPKMKQAQR
jgi:hypothetical protein